ncbi:MAG TPA: hypothetical protein VN176_08265 [Verrucomicrobiae bacterium]|nr:hypothetical protein [Verrucomicrobiae bacterium]
MNTASPGSSTFRTLLLLLGLVACLTQASPAQGEGPRPPAVVVAGTDFSVSTPGSGKATFYLVGPSHSSKQQIDLGQGIYIKGDEVLSAGRYLVVLCAQTCQSAAFYVTPAGPASLTFLAHPSRVPVRQDNAISGVVFPLDKFRNLVLAPVTINFKLTADRGDSSSRLVRTKDGVAWLRVRSGNVTGTVQLVASTGDVSVRRVVRQVASDPCNLRIKVERTAKGIVVETEPVRDCSGNTVPDGTIVTFTKIDGAGKSTVDAPIKQGIARAQMSAARQAVISVASGVVMGNPIRLSE